MDCITAIGTARAMRWFRADPVPADIVEQLVWAATRAGSAHNSQPWDFVVVDDPEVRAAIGAAVADAVRVSDPMPVAESAADRRIEAGVRNLFANMAEAPILIIICGRNCYPHSAPNEKFLWSAMGAAAQNLVVAGRGLGVGVATTMFHVLAEARIREIIGLPGDHLIGYTAVVGWPAREFGELARRPLDEVVHRNRW